MSEIARIALDHGAWLHVDAAYAGPAAMIQELRPAFKGWQLADSIVLNPHKWLGTSLDCSVLLYRDALPFKAALSLTPAYLESEAEETNLMDVGLPLGRRFRGLKLWVLFRCVGTDGLAASIQGHIEMARTFAECIEDSDLFGLAAPVSFSTVCFRAASDLGIRDGDRLNRGILQRVNAEGRVFLSHTELDGRYTLRMSVGSVHTESEHVEEAFAALHRAAVELLPAEHPEFGDKR